MVVLKEKLVNINSSVYNSAMSNPMDSNTVCKNINMEVPRGKTNHLSTNSSRKL